MTQPFFEDVGRIEYAGADSTEPLAYRWYDAERPVLGATMAEQLRLAVCYWHTLCWPGSDVFGEATFDRPWLAAGGDEMDQARQKLAVAFEFIEKLGVPFFCFHDRDVAPEGASFSESCDRLDRLLDDVQTRMESSGIRLLWGTANLFGHPRYAAGAATNPDPQVFAYAAAQVKHCLEATHRLGGENYVLWGGREGYETLLNTDMKREMAQLGRFMQIVVEHKHAIGFKGTILIEPKPHEPTKHQYDYDAAAVYAFLQKFGLDKEIKLNIEVNHATLAGHSFQHELVYSIAHGILGSVDANRGDPQNGWDTDQFPNSVEEMSLALYEIYRNGGLGTGGFNFDAKLRRQSCDPVDLFHAHIGGIDTIARALLCAERLIEEDALATLVSQRYRAWDGSLGEGILGGELAMGDLYALVREGGVDPTPVSGRQEMLERRVSRCLEQVTGD